MLGMESRFKLPAAHTYVHSQKWDISLEDYGLLMLHLKGELLIDDASCMGHVWGDSAGPRKQNAGRERLKSNGSILANEGLWHRLDMPPGAQRANTAGSRQYMSFQHGHRRYF